MPKSRVLVVDDSVVIRRLVSEAVTADPELELAGWASDGRLALQRIEQVNPDCITLDIEMPNLDGIQTLIEIRKRYPRMPVIMFSTLTDRGGQKTLEALQHGATDYVTKPANVGSVTECIDRLSAELIPKIHACTRRVTVPKGTVVPFKAPERKQRRESEIIVIASSTGGPNALSEVVPALPANLALPILIAQHMPPVFTRLFSERLNDLSALTVHEGEQHMEVLRGHVYIAPGGKHMEVVRQGNQTFLNLTEDPPENSCRPAADVLFRSVVKHYAGAVLGVVLTGMGSDGLRGCRHVVEAGGQVLAQDASTSVVWGMPGSVAEAGLADKVLPLSEIAGAILARMPKRIEALLG